MSSNVPPAGALSPKADEGIPAEQFAELLGDIWLHIDWYHVTRHLTTEQKELFADSVDTSSYYHAVEEGRTDEWQPVAVQWWREDYVGPSPRDRRKS